MSGVMSLLSKSAEESEDGTYWTCCKVVFESYVNVCFVLFFFSPDASVPQTAGLNSIRKEGRIDFR